MKVDCTLTFLQKTTQHMSIKCIEITLSEPKYLKVGFGMWYICKSAFHIASNPPLFLIMKLMLQPLPKQNIHLISLNISYEYSRQELVSYAIYVVLRSWGKSQSNVKSVRAFPEGFGCVGSYSAGQVPSGVCTQEYSQGQSSRKGPSHSSLLAPSSEVPSCMKMIP